MSSSVTSLPTENRPSDNPPAPQPPDPFGVLVLYDSPEAIVDIVAIHGLDGHREDSWTINNVLWLRDLLPRDLPKVRVLTYGYDADTAGARPLSRQTIDDHANGFVLRLTQHRILSDTIHRPIIFLAHSLGGIILKSALLKADQSREGHLEDQLDFKLSTYGILFLGTPHQGTDQVDFITIFKRIHAAFKGVNVNNRVLQHLERDSEMLLKQLSDYLGISGHFDTKFIYEMYPPPGHSDEIVPKASAVVPGAVNAQPVALHKDHAGLARFQAGEDDYTLLLGLLKGMINKSVAKVERNWTRYERMKSAALEDP